MEYIKQKIAQAGLVLAALGVMSIVLSLFNYNVKLLAWVDLWGESMGWIIRISLIIGGGALFFLLGRDED